MNILPLLKLLIAVAACGILFFMLLLYRRGKNIRSFINVDFLVLLTILLVIDLPYFEPAFRFIPAHDTMSHLQAFSIVVHEYVVHGQLPLWLPYDIYGNAVDATGALSLPAYVVIVLAKWFSMTDTLLLFNISIFLEQCILLTGTYLLARRLFTHRATIVFVAAGSIAMSFWAIQIQLNFRISYFIPLIFFVLIKFHDTFLYRYLFLSGLLAIFSLFGTVVYISPLFVLVYGIMFASMLFFDKKPWRFPCRLSKGFAALAMLGLLLLVGMLSITFLYLQHSQNYAVFYAPERDPATLQVSLKTFLTYAMPPQFNTLLELVYAIPSNCDRTFYIGLLPLIFLLYALLRVKKPYLHIILLIAGILLAFSLAYATVIATLLYLFFPLFPYFRHIFSVISLVKMLLLIASGFGVDAYFDSCQSPHPDTAWLLKIGVGVLSSILALDLLIFRGTLPYSSYLQNTLVPPFQFIADMPLFQLHYIPMMIAAIFLILLYRGEWLRQRNLPYILLACFFVEILSYQYWLFFISPVMLPNSVVNAVETSAHPESPAIRIQEYSFQPSRVSQQQVSQFISKTSPGLNNFWGAYYGFLYSAAMVDPCFQEYRVQSAMKGIDRFIRARSGLSLDDPAIQIFSALPKVFFDDSVFLRAIGCGTPKLFLTTQAHIAQSLDEAAALIRQQQDIDTTPVLWSETDAPLSASSAPIAVSENSRPAGTVAVTEFTANRVSINADVTSPGGAWLIYLDAYHPSWSATVDGTPRPILTANLGFKAVRVETGQHHVQFRFHGNGWNAVWIQVFFGIGIGSTATLLIGMLWISLPIVGEVIVRITNVKR